MWVKYVFLALIGASFGMIVSAGVFTVLISVGLVPRFAGKTHTSRHVMLYENLIILGTLSGNVLSMWSFRMGFSAWLLVPVGVFAGIFVGCLALAIAEMLDTIPIFARRIGFRRGLGFAVLSIALGKAAGSLLFFIMRWGKS